VAGWPGSDIRLWAVSLPARVGRQQPPTTITATAYDAAGHVLGQVHLGSIF
jgi:YD repeat-containing protein